MLRGRVAGITQAMNTDRLDLTDLLEVSDLLLRGQTFRFRVAGWSMSPTLQKGDQLTVEPVSPAQLQVGDLLLFHRHGRLICHRLAGLNQTGPVPTLITRGDAATGCDAPLRPEHVLGRVVGVRPRLRWAGSRSQQIDRWQARLRDKVAQGFVALQGLGAYRWMTRALLSRFVAYSVGIPEGRRWFRYHWIGGRRPPGAPAGRHQFHLVAKLAGICVGSLQIESGADGFWLQSLYIRIPYRGLGVGSQLLALAATAASRSRTPVLLALVEPANTAALHLFTKSGFRDTGGHRSHQVSLRRDL